MTRGEGGTHHDAFMTTFDAPTGTRQAAVWHAPGTVVVETVPQQPVGPGDVRVRITSVGVCGSDVHFFHRGHESGRDTAPFVMGHEAAGVVVEVGSAVTADLVGTRVAVEPGVPCGRCAECRRGTYNLCVAMVFFADPPVDGALATDVVLDAHFVHPVPDTMTDHAAALLEPVSCAIAACRRAEVTAGTRVLITGAGPIGLLCARVARLFGARRIVVSDVHPGRLAAALAGGADAVLDVTASPLAELGEGFDVHLECSGVPAVAADGIGLLANRGRAVLVGMGLGETIALPVAALQNREVTVTGAFRYANTYATALELAPLLHLDDLVSHTFTLEQTGEAMRAPREVPGCLKAMIVLPAGRLTTPPDGE